MSFFSKSAVANALLLGVSCVLCIVATEFILRWRYPERPPAVTEEVRQVQAHLKLRPTLGYTWQENIPFTDQILLKVSDTELDPLSTDRRGFIDPPEAIAEEQAGAPTDVIGLGDSFMEHGSFLFHALFKDAGLSFYNMAIHRQCPPQYNIILNDYALPKKPKWVIYGLFENDFDETEDFERWKQSGLDWFAYHSGTWCGRPQTASAFERAVRGATPGFYVTYHRVVEKLKLSNTQAAKALSVSPSKVAGYIRAARDSTRANGTHFLLLLIPGKVTALTGHSPESALYDELLTMLAADNIDTLDLRVPFKETGRPESLYYAIDGHWNRNGIRAAASAILARIQTQSVIQTPSPQAIGQNQ
jgi:hypothetical protein